MQVPEFLHGKYADVNREVTKRIRRYIHGAPWEEVMAGSRVDASVLPGWLVLEGPLPALGSAPHTHLYLPAVRAFTLLADAPKDDARQARMDALSMAMLAEPWSTLGLNSQLGRDLLAEGATRMAFLRSMVRSWDIFQGVADRCAPAVMFGIPFWKSLTATRYLLTHLGLPAGGIAPHPPGGLAELLGSYGLLERIQTQDDWPDRALAGS